MIKQFYVHTYEFPAQINANDTRIKRSSQDKDMRAKN